MMCYRDQTFCKFDDCEKWDGCPKAYTDTVKKAAGDWWERGGGKRDEAPVCLWVDMPGCHSKKFALG
jgi:hypothetical protein